MRKIIKVFLLFDLMMGALFLGAYGLKGEALVTDSGLVRMAEAEEQQDEIRKIAITFDDEVIIGLSQEICCIEAISLI